MSLTFNDETWMWVLINIKGNCLACVFDMNVADMLLKMYQDQEDAYYNSVDFHDGPWCNYRYL